jgi:GNAT superfamily N-acetyltransferase
VTISVRRIPLDDEAGLTAYVRIRNGVAPEAADSLEQVAWAETTYPGQGAWFLATDEEGAVIGTASTGRIWMHPQAYERYWIGIWVVPEARGRGAGQALYEACSDAAREAGKTGFQTELSEVHVDGLRFAKRRGFVVTDRNKMVRLDLGGLEPPEPAAPPGIRIVSLAERPDLVRAIHAAAIETFPDIPSDDEQVDAADYEAFVARDVERTGIPLDAFMVAVDDASGEVAGYASLMLDAGDPLLAYHDMTAVRRAYRGRGIATALKRATIAWAVEHGLRALETGNDERNAPMRAVNAHLGYRPVPDWLGLQGPLAPRT